MPDEICTVQFAAERLKLHPKTVLRFIRDGQLRATRVGKSYRIARADLEEFAGMPVRAEPAAEDASVTCIVDIPGVAPELARKWAKVVMNALQPTARRGGSLRAQVIHEPERSLVKIIVIGTPGDAVNMLSLIRVWIDQLKP